MSKVGDLLRSALGLKGPFPIHVLLSENLIETNKGRVSLRIGKDVLKLLFPITLVVCRLQNRSIFEVEIMREERFNLKEKIAELAVARKIIVNLEVRESE